MSPPKENHPSMWEFKLGVDSPREVITYDLEEFTKVGIHAVRFCATPDSAQSGIRS